MSKRKRTALLFLATATVLVVSVILVSSWDRIAAWYRFRLLFEPIGKNEQGYPEYRHRQTGIVMVRVPGGTFMMGSPESEEGRDESEGPQHEVTLGPFLLGKYEVSQEQFKTVMEGFNPSEFKGSELPVEELSRDDCREFSRRSGLRLPTEAQWEFACRAGATTPFGYGEFLTRDQANYDGGFRYGGGPFGDKSESTMPVDSLEPNAFGLHHMHGNVWEWCEDIYDAEFYSKAEAMTDPLSTKGSTRGVMRGGSWSLTAESARCAERRDLWFSYREEVGFRPAYYPLP